MGDKPTIYISNVFAATSPYKLGGASSHKISAITPFLKDVTGGFIVISHRDVFWASFTADVARCEEPEVVIQIFEKNMD